MTLGLDTDVLVSWAMAGSPHHHAARKLLESELSIRGASLALTPQVLFEFVHVVTDPRRFERPMTMDRALSMARDLWDAPETMRVVPPPTMLHRALELLGSLRLGRKRILDTALAATLSEAGVDRLATFNHQDFEIFPFLEVVVPNP
ncbi:MAG: type II toxin-antitoxin system VapC family toxin [Acidobacteriota bacterium]